MPRYFAFLRAINVGGHTVKMDRLRALFEALGFNSVETFIASGNVIFEARAGAAKLEARIAQHLGQALGYEVATFLRTQAELDVIADRAPFPAPALADPASRLYVALAGAAPTAEAAQTLQDARSAIDDFAIDGREVYWLRRAGLADRNLPAPPLEKLLGQPVTVRNATTVRKLRAKYAGAAAGRPG